MVFRNGTVAPIDEGEAESAEAPARKTSKPKKISSASNHKISVCSSNLPPPPEDEWAIVYWIIFLVGIICMMPWDMLMTVNGYWEYKFRNESFDKFEDDPNATEPALTKRQKEFMSYLSIASSVPGSVVVIAHAFVGNRFRVSTRAVLSLFGMVAAFFVIIVMAYVDSDDWSTAFMATNLVLAVVINVFRALFRATNSANMGKFPVKYMGSLANGICMGGLIPVVVNILILSMDVDIQMAGFGCFVFACGVAVLCLVLYFYMEKSPFYKYYTYFDEMMLSERSGRKTSSPKVTASLLLFILSRSWLFTGAILLTGMTTTMVYPGVISLVRPVYPDDTDWDEVFFSQVTCYLTFNVFNQIGTTVAGLVQWPHGTSVNSQVTVFLFALFRVSLIPVLMLCNVAPSVRSHLEVLLPSDAAFVFFVAIFSFSDGYINNVAMMFGPKSSGAESGLQEVTAGVLVATSSTAITLGSVLSAALVKAL